MAGPQGDPGDSPRTEPAARRLGDFELIEELGRGGMGVVYKARQHSLGRFVAVKVLPSFAGMDPAAVARFRREAEASARLAHPGILPVYDVGDAEGTHFFAMELVDGPSLSDLLDGLRGRVPGRLLKSLAEETGIDHRFPALRDFGDPEHGETRYAQSCAALVADVANALGVAHESRIVHRDVKPSNVMIRGDGRPVILDFGLARDERSLGLTRSGDAVGTPSYMAPEQAAGRRDVDARADVYGLGATLYEMLTLRPPVEGAHAADTIRKILDEDVVPVRKLNPRVPEDLENIVHTCLAKDPDGRYPAIGSLERDLRAFLSGRTVEARRPTAKERAARFLHRNRRNAAVAVITLAVAGLAGLTAGVMRHQEAARQGRGALADARVQLLEYGDVMQALELHGRAEALLADDEIVGAARRELAIEAFERLYPSGELEVLQRFFTALPDHERVTLRHYFDKIRGHGRLVLSFAGADELPTEAVSLKAFHGGRLQGEWQPLPADRVLPIGDYLLRIDAGGWAPWLRKVTVLRDAEAVVAVVLRPASELPPGTVEVTDTASDLAVAVSRTELSWGDYQEFLDGIGDPVLRSEMSIPEMATASALDQPVRGMTFRQARACAAARGVHLLSEREYRLAATAGFELTYPWGRLFDADRVAADPAQRSAADSVDSRPRGASPLGIVHLLGNVGEILSPGADGSIPLAGGHFLSPPDALRLDAPDLVVSLPSADHPGAHAGMRVASFLGGSDSRDVGRPWAARRAEILGRGGSLLHEWVVGEQGGLAYQLTVSGVHQSDEPVMRLPLSTAGFLLTSAPTVRDGHGRELLAEFETPAPQESCGVTVQLATAPQPGQGYRLQIDSQLVAIDGLRGEGDSYVLRLPMNAAGRFPIVHRLTLPPGCHVDRCDPPPRDRTRAGGRTSLLWEFEPDGLGLRMIPAVVRFRRDGPLTAAWPVRERVDVSWREFFRALLSGDRDRLQDTVHPAYLQRPSGLGKLEITATTGSPAEQSVRGFGAPRLVDFTAVGPVVTIDLLTDWTTSWGERAVVVHDWPLQLQMIREGQRQLAVRLMPRSRHDRGEITREGFYRHRGLEAEVRSPGVQVNRSHDELTEMQVLYVRDGEAADGGVWFQVLGHRARPDETEDEVRVWLTAGAIALRQGQPLVGSQVDRVGPESARLEGESMHWVFGEGDGDSWARERWTFLRKGLRSFLVKAIARAGSREQAEQLFEGQRDWFDAMARTIVIE